MQSHFVNVKRHRTQRQNVFVHFAQTFVHMSNLLVKNAACTCLFKFKNKEILETPANFTSAVTVDTEQTFARWAVRIFFSTDIDSTYHIDFAINRHTNMIWDIIFTHIDDMIHLVSF